MTDNTQSQLIRNQFDCFTVFPKLPAELRIKIWKLSYVPRRIDLEDAGESSKFDLISGASLLVNFEARQIFLENYSRCFRNTDQKEMYLNFSVDILYVKSSLQGFQKFHRTAPAYNGLLSRFQWVEVESLYRYFDERSLQWSPMNLEVFSACKHITIRSSSDTSSWLDNVSDSTDRIMQTFNHLRKALLQCPGPKLGAVFIEPLPISGIYEAESLLKKFKRMGKSIPEHLLLDAESLLETLDLEDEALPENLYIEAESDMKHGSFGTFKLTNPGGDFSVDWIVQKRTWKEIDEEYCISEGMSYFRKGDFWK